jgi:hypothetical protein
MDKMAGSATCNACGWTRRVILRLRLRCRSVWLRIVASRAASRRKIRPSSMYTWLSVATPAELEKLKDLVPPRYAPRRVAAKLAKGISGAVKRVLIEGNYIDKDYRSTYYSFYAKKGQQYDPDCIRLHFFDDTVAFDANALTLSCPDNRLTDHYFGFIVVRPTTIATIGRSVVSPDVRNGACRYIITADHKVHLLGYRLAIEGFPSMDQHVDISVCAHVACWSILRHYSERYSVYREYLTYDITLMAQEFNPGGLVPSKGLQVSHAERVFQEAGTFPVHVARDDSVPVDISFYRQLLAYVDSGFPLFAAMHKRGHAVAVVGYDWDSTISLAAPRLLYAWDLVKSLAVVDDNDLPYLSIGKSGTLPYAADDIDAFIVALPEKVYYPADAVDRFAEALFSYGGSLKLPSKEQSIIRYFITTGSAFRKFVREHESEYDPQLVKTVMTLPFAQFIWIIEYATATQWQTGQITARAVVDATASLREPFPVWLFHNREDALVFDRRSMPTAAGGFVLSPTTHSGYSRMVQNLRPTQSK